jgi:hypothetical protein
LYAQAVDDKIAQVTLGDQSSSQQRRQAFMTAAIGAVVPVVVLPEEHTARIGLNDSIAPKWTQ